MKKMVFQTGPLTLLLTFTVAASVFGHSRSWTEAAVDARPSSIPDRVVLTWSGDPSTSQAVTWRTDETVVESYAEIAPASASPDFHKGAERVRAHNELLPTKDGVCRCHSVEFTGLAPNSTYAYRVGSKKAWSEWFHFRTAGGGEGSFSFIYLGDEQNEILSLWSRVIRAAYGMAPEAAFILHAGDLVNEGHVDSYWAEWFAAGGWIFAQVPSIPVVGNHEYYGGDEREETLPPHWRAQFTLPENGIRGQEEANYYLDYDGVRIVVLNSNEELERQADWLNEVLADHGASWTVVAFHHPIYSAAAGRDNEELRELWEPIFDRYMVDLVLQGHDHTYARGTAPVTEAGRTDGESAPVYVVSVSGPKMYKLRKDRWMERAGENTQLYQVIAVSSDTLRYRSYTVMNELYDSFYLVKRQGKASRLVVDLPPGIPERTF